MNPEDSYTEEELEEVFRDIAEGIALYKDMLILETLKKELESADESE